MRVALPSQTRRGDSIVVPGVENESILPDRHVITVIDDRLVVFYFLHLFSNHLVFSPFTIHADVLKGFNRLFSIEKKILFSLLGEEWRGKRRTSLFNCLACDVEWPG